MAVAGPVRGRRSKIAKGKQTARFEMNLRLVATLLLPTALTGFVPTSERSSKISVGALVSLSGRAAWQETASKQRDEEKRENEARATSFIAAAHQQYSKYHREENKRIQESKRELKVKGRKEREDWFVSNPFPSTSIRLSVPASTSTIQSEHQE